MSKQVKILSGCSGSGKSTLCRSLQAACHVQNPTYSTIVSADDFFMVENQDDDSKPPAYQFNASKLGEAHASCFKKFILAMQKVHTFTHTDGEVVHLPNNLIIVDNTNTTVAEIAPYVLAASAFGYEHEILTIVHPNDYKYRDSDRDWKYAQQCAARNTHGVNVHAILSQVKRIEKRELPPHWKHRVVLAQG